VEAQVLLEMDSVMTTTITAHVNMMEVIAVEAPEVVNNIHSAIR
jgi:hypothetical protein